MKRPLILIIIAVVVLIAVALLGFVVFTLTMKKPATVTNTPNPFGTSGTVSANESTATLKNGSTVTIPDPTKIPQPEGYVPSQGYQVAGSDTGNFQVLYFSAKNGGTEEFLISILSEPIGANRLAAEKELQQKTGLTNDQMCQLSDVEVYVDSGVNDSYAGRNLGLSFCPGATKLP
jgi:cytoskeletal protein RodZ